MLSNACNTRKLHQRGTASDNFNVEKSACKSVQNSRKWRAAFASYTRRIFIFLVQNSDNPTYATVVTGPTKSRQDAAWSRPDTRPYGLRHPEPYNDRRIKRENARESGCS